LTLNFSQLFSYQASLLSLERCLDLSSLIYEKRRRKETEFFKVFEKDWCDDILCEKNPEQFFFFVYHKKIFSSIFFPIQCSQNESIRFFLSSVLEISPKAHLSFQ